MVGIDLDEEQTELLLSSINVYVNELSTMINTATASGMIATMGVLMRHRDVLGKLYDSIKTASDKANGTT